MPHRIAAIALAATLTALPSLAAAADWWITGEGVDGSRSLSDIESRQCGDGHCTIWERTIPSPSQPDAKVVDSLAEYDCSGGRTATSAEATYGPGMKQLSLVRARQLNWYAVDSGTVGQRGLLFACRADMSGRPRGGEDQAEIQGQPFVRDVSTQPAPPSLAAPPVLVATAAPTPLPPVSEPVSTAPPTPVAPPVRPQVVAAGPSTLAPSPPPPVRPELPPAAPAPKGPPQLAQIGAFASWAVARAALDTLQSSDPPLMAGLTTRVDPVTSNGRKMFRAIVTGFPTPDDAQSFCMALQGAGKPCLVRAAAGG